MNDAVAIPTDADLDALLRQHQAIRRSLPNTWNAFFARFGRLRPIQLAAIPAIVSAQNTLVTAPTAGGKTEAVVAPICERLLRLKWTGLSAILITPTRALVNDLYSRLEMPCAKAGVKLGRKTSDHPMSATGMEQLLITTPESVESLLTFRRDTLRNVRAVIMDEIHLLDGTPRGDQLRFLLQRLLQYLRYARQSEVTDVQRVALSATIPDAARVATAYLGETSSIISVPGQREIEARIVVAAGTDRVRAEATMEAAATFDDVRKVLVFVNSRKQVDAGTEYFRYGRFSKLPVYGHHGSLSKEERENTEAHFKSDARAICVATMTLEVGIDIGDVDLVVCVDPPFSLSSFLQRIGRGCRRMLGKTRVVCVARDRAGELMFEGLVRQSQLGMLAVPQSPLRRSVLLQQILAYLKQVDRYRRTEQQFVRSLATLAEPKMPEATIREVLEDMISTGLLSARHGVYEPASEGWGFIESRRIYSNIAPTPMEISLFDVDTGKLVARVKNLAAGAAGVRIAGRSFDVLPGNGKWRQTVRAGGQAEASPAYQARKLPYSCDVGQATAARLGIGPEQVLAVEHNGTIVVMTWLGRLMNLALQAAAKDGNCIQSSSFALSLVGGTTESVMTVLQRAVATLRDINPLGHLNVAQIVDVGPHFRALTEEGQRKAREEWLDLDYLISWLDTKKTITAVAPDTPLGMDLLALSKA